LNIQVTEINFFVILINGGLVLPKNTKSDEMKLVTFLVIYCLWSCYLCIGTAKYAISFSVFYIVIIVQHAIYIAEHKVSSRTRKVFVSKLNLGEINRKK
jgi:hypothetical protein